MKEKDFINLIIGFVIGGLLENINFNNIADIIINGLMIVLFLYTFYFINKRGKK